MRFTAIKMRDLHKIGSHKHPLLKPEDRQQQTPLSAEKLAEPASAFAPQWLKDRNPYPCWACDVFLASISCFSCNLCVQRSLPDTGVDLASFTLLTPTEDLSRSCSPRHRLSVVPLTVGLGEKFTSESTPGGWLALAHWSIGTMQ